MTICLKLDMFMFFNRRRGGSEGGGNTAMKTVVLATFLAIVLSGPALADDPSGTWAMDNGKVTVKVSPCGTNLCGKIVALAKPLDKHGKPKLDKDNPNPALRHRPVVGLTLFRNMKRAGENRWEGTIYVPEDGYTYRASANLSGNVLKVRGCYLVICKTKRLVRVN
jgi:uncharacterized protein (DUF2147 family)